MSDELRRPEVFIGTDVRLAVAESGAVVATHSAAEYGSWRPYVAAFGEVVIVGRIAPSGAKGSDLPVTGPGVKARLVPGYSGFLGFATALPAMWKQIRTLGDESSIFVGRPPEPLSLLLFRRARQAGARYVAIVGTESEQFMRGLIPGPAGYVLGRVLRDMVRHVVRKSHAAVYVTQELLQSLYPVTPGTPTIGRSNVVLAEADFADRPRRAPRSSSGLSLISVGSVNTRAKGSEDLIRVLAELRRSGQDATLRVVGGGSRLADLRDFATRQGVAEYVQLEGHVASRTRIRELLDEADIYLTMSRAEGLPRATIEAMARGLPVVSTRAGGIAEVVREQQLVPIGDPVAAARVITAIVTDTAAYAAASEVSIERARGVAASADPQRLTDFLERHL